MTVNAIGQDKICQLVRPQWPAQLDGPADGTVQPAIELLNHNYMWAIVWINDNWNCVIVHVYCVWLTRTDQYWYCYCSYCADYCSYWWTVLCLDCWYCIIVVIERLTGRRGRFLWPLPDWQPDRYLIYYITITLIDDSREIVTWLTLKLKPVVAMDYSRWKPILMTRYYYYGDCGIINLLLFNWFELKVIYYSSHRMTQLLRDEGQLLYCDQCRTIGRQWPSWPVIIVVLLIGDIIGLVLIIEAWPFIDEEGYIIVVRTIIDQLLLLLLLLRKWNDLLTHLLTQLLLLLPVYSVNGLLYCYWYYCEIVIIIIVIPVLNQLTHLLVRYWCLLDQLFDVIDLTSLLIG